MVLWGEGDNIKVIIQLLRFGKYYIDPSQSWGQRRRQRQRIMTRKGGKASCSDTLNLLVPTLSGEYPWGVGGVSMAPQGPVGERWHAATWKKCARPDLEVAGVFRVIFGAENLIL